MHPERVQMSQGGSFSWRYCTSRYWCWWVDVQCVWQPSITLLLDLTSKLLPSWQRRHLLATSSEADRHPSIFFNSCLQHLVSFSYECCCLCKHRTLKQDMSLLFRCVLLTRSGIERSMFRSWAMFGEEIMHFFSIAPTLHSDPECKAKDFIPSAPSIVSHILLANVFLHFHCLPRWQVLKKKNKRQKKTFCFF